MAVTIFVPMQPGEMVFDRHALLRHRARATGTLPSHWTTLRLRFCVVDRDLVIPNSFPSTYPQLQAGLRLKSGLRRPPVRI
jgi:hypothetical protein